MQKHKKIFSILLVLITIACIVWLIFKGNEENFWNVRFFEIISIYLTTILGLIGLFITLFILEYNNEERRFTDALSILITKMIEILNISTIIPNIPDDAEEFNIVKKKTLSIIKTFNNYVSILRKYDKKINLEKEIEQIFNLFGRYETIIDTCFQNKKICDETITKLEMCVNLILYNLYEISVKLYVPK